MPPVPMDGIRQFREILDLVFFELIQWIWSFGVQTYKAEKFVWVLSGSIWHTNYFGECRYQGFPSTNQAGRIY